MGTSAITALRESWYLDFTQWIMADDALVILEVVKSTNDGDVIHIYLVIVTRTNGSLL